MKQKAKSTIYRDTKKNKGIMSNMNNRAGITLIALVISIIVLLILAAVSIATLTGENGVLTKASDAKIQTRASSAEEAVKLWRTENHIYDVNNEKLISKEELLQKLVKDELVYENEIDRKNEKIYIKKNDGTIVKEIFYGNENKIDPNNIKVGDFINYQNVLLSEKSNSYKTDINKTGYTSSQEFTTNTNSLWRVISNEGETIKIIPNTPTYDLTGEGLYICGYTGYGNSITVLDGLCDELYTTSVAEAKNLREEDCELLLEDIIELIAPNMISTDRSVCWLANQFVNQSGDILSVKAIDSEYGVVTKSISGAGNYLWIETLKHGIGVVPIVTIKEGTSFILTGNKEGFNVYNIDKP